jgi:DNA-binding NtrC family response regulator
MIYLWEYDWPGNVRELENLIERLVVLSDKSVIGPEDLPLHIRSFISEKKLPHPTLSNGEVNLQQALEQLESRLIDEALRLTNGNKTAAAQMLGLKRTTLVAKLRRKKNCTILLSSAHRNDVHAS